jgi:hypothetical protein
MGDRGNIRIDYGDDNSVYFYGHWSGSEMFDILKSALSRGRSRWGDEQYLSRIIFCELIKDDVMGLTGFGISTFIGDNEYKVLAVEMETQTVHMVTEEGEELSEWSFEEFIALTDDPRQSGR